MTVLANVAVDVDAFTVSWRPPGVVENVSTTVLGCRFTLVVADNPPESVAVS
jgi:hypothetical protein